MDKAYVLVMEESDGDRSYYAVPEPWYQWRLQPFGTPMPQDLADAYHAECSTEDLHEFTWRTNQVLAVDDNYLGSSLQDIAEYTSGREIVELQGTWL